VLRLPIDRVPFFPLFGPWHETMQRWKEESSVGEGSWYDGHGYDSMVHSVYALNANDGPINAFYNPPYVPEVLEEKDGKQIVRDYLGIICEIVPGKSGIPRIIKNPVSNLEDWLQLKHSRLNPDDPDRYSKNWGDIVKKYNEGDFPVQIGAFPWGLFGSLRDLMGAENALIAFYDNPALVHTIMDDLTDFWLSLNERICRDIRVDAIHIWEDMSGKTGSLLSPDMVEEFMLPRYRRIKRFADEHGIPVLSVDTDGNCEKLIPLFESAGVNLMFPFEVAAGCDVVSLHSKYPNIAFQGGINKMALAEGKEAIDEELLRIEPLLSQTGYMPCLDHAIPPKVSYENYCYYTKRLRELIFKHKRVMVDEQ